jgi:hypothetical protein
MGNERVEKHIVRRDRWIAAVMTQGTNAILWKKRTKFLSIAVVEECTESCSTAHRDEATRSEERPSYYILAPYHRTHLSGEKKLSRWMAPFKTNFRF